MKKKKQMVKGCIAYYGRCIDGGSINRLRHNNCR